MDGVAGSAFCSVSCVTTSVAFEHFKLLKMGTCKHLVVCKVSIGASDMIE
jgi:hypothetical protein